MDEIVELPSSDSTDFLSSTLQRGLLAPGQVESGEPYLQGREVYNVSFDDVYVVQSGYGSVEVPAPLLAANDCKHNSVCAPCLEQK